MRQFQIQEINDIKESLAKEDVKIPVDIIQKAIFMPDDIGLMSMNERDPTKKYPTPAITLMTNPFPKKKKKKKKKKGKKKKKKK